MNEIIKDIAPMFPQVGMGCTILHWTDRSPCTIVAVSKTGKSFDFTYDDYRRTDSNGMSQDQTYEYAPRPDAARYKARLSKDGRYRAQGQVIVVGKREAYFDPHF
jgi:hypothetical protein